MKPVLFVVAAVAGLGCAMLSGCEARKSHHLDAALATVAQQCPALPSPSCAAPAAAPRVGRRTRSTAISHAASRHYASVSRAGRSDVEGLDDQQSALASGMTTHSRLYVHADAADEGQVQSGDVPACVLEHHCHGERFAAHDSSAHDNGEEHFDHRAAGVITETREEESVSRSRYSEAEYGGGEGYGARRWTGVNAQGYLTWPGKIEP